MATNLRLKVIAEGVETEEQMSFLRGHHCDEIQGYYFSKPESVSEAGRRLNEEAAFTRREFRPKLVGLAFPHTGPVGNIPVSV